MITSKNVLIAFISFVTATLMSGTIVYILSVANDRHISAKVINAYDDGRNTIKFTPMFNALQLVQARDYQIDIIEDSLLIYDGTRYVGTIPAFDSSRLCQLMLKDNQ